MARPKAQPQPVEVIEEAKVHGISVGDVQPDLPPPAVTTNTANLPAPEDDQKVFDTATEEFNEHVKSLVRLFFEQEVQGLEQRITDLETVVGRMYTPDVPQQTIEAPSYHSEIPDYKPQHQGGQGAPWYYGD